MNKSQLVDALAARMGDRHTAASAVEGLLDIIVTTVGSGDSVSLTGFGVFEARPRAARVARNPRTGTAVDVPPTTVPAFRPGTGFRSSVSGNGIAPTAAAAVVVETPVAVATPAESGHGKKAAGKVGAKKSGKAKESTKAKESGKAKVSTKAKESTKAKPMTAKATTAKPTGEAAGGKAGAKSAAKKTGPKAKARVTT